MILAIIPDTEKVLMAFKRVFAVNALEVSNFDDELREEHLKVARFIFKSFVGLLSFQKTF